MTSQRFPQQTPTPLLPLHPPTRTRRHLNPLPVLGPRARPRIIQHRGPLHERKAEVLVRFQLRLALPHEAATVARLVVDVAAEALDVVDEDAYAVECGLEVGPGEGDVGVACCGGGEFDGGGEEGGEFGVVLRVVEERGVGLEEGVEAPAGNAVDKEAEEDALVEQAGAGLHARSWDEEDRQDVVVDAEVEAGNGDADDDAEEDDGVETEVAEQAAFEAEGPDLLHDDGEKEDGDEGEGCFGTGLLLEVVRG